MLLREVEHGDVQAVFEIERETTMMPKWKVVVRRFDETSWHYLIYELEHDGVYCLFAQGWGGQWAGKGICIEKGQRLLNDLCPGSTVEVVE